MCWSYRSMRWFFGFRIRRRMCICCICGNKRRRRRLRVSMLRLSFLCLNNAKRFLQRRSLNSWALYSWHGLKIDLLLIPLMLFEQSWRHQLPEPFRQLRTTGQQIVIFACIYLDSQNFSLLLVVDLISLGCRDKEGRCRFLYHSGQLSGFRTILISMESN